MADRPSGLVAMRAYRKARGVSDTTMWRETQRGVWHPVNICGRLYLKVSEIEVFERRATEGAFARTNPGAFVANNA